MSRLSTLCCLIPASADLGWEIGDGACLKGHDFKNRTISWKVAQGLSSYKDCQSLCEQNSTCHAFNFVGDLLDSTRLLNSAVLTTGDCWFRLDDAWSLSLGKYNQTSGHLVNVPSPAPKGAKNVLFIMFDDLRAMHKTYGWSQPHLPNHERLAAESLVFDRAYVQQAVCGPSRASFMSGRRPDHTQMYNFLNGDAPGGFRNAPGATAWNTFPQWFKMHGYYTAGAGKLYHSGDPGHDDPPSWVEPECITDFPMYGQGKCPVPKELLKEMGKDGNGCPVDTQVYKNCSDDVMCFPDEHTLVTAKRFLNKAAAQYQNSGQPFWLGVGFVKPHIPHIYPKEFLDVVPSFNDIDLPPNPNFPNGTPAIAHHEHTPSVSIDIPASPDKVRNFRRAYYAAAAYSDYLLGQLLDEVDTLELSKDTLVILSSDHGWGLGEHNHWEKFTNFETDTRVPMFVRAPWKSKAMGKRTSALVEHVDMYPSAAELVGVAVDKSKESIDGTSWAHLLDKPSATHLSGAYSQYPRCWPDGMKDDPAAFPEMARCTSVEKEEIAYMGYSIRTAEWRYTEWAKWDGTTLKPDWTSIAGIELYDHRKDAPEDSKASFEQFENENVFSEHPKVIAELSNQLHAFVARQHIASFTV